MLPSGSRARSRRSSAWKRVAAVGLAVLGVTVALPPAASAHGPVAPVATGYLARIAGVPAGVRAKVVDGYVRMWTQVAPTNTVVVLDYRGAPYLRFSPAGVQVNHNSEMFYLNMTPVPVPPPAHLTPTTPPHWALVSTGHSYEWHDGRLQALASVALAPGTRYVGRWSIPLRIGDRAAAISGGLWHAPRPSPVWFWPIAVVLLCVLAGWRVRNDNLDALLVRALAWTALLGSVVAAVGLELHGRPGIPAFHFVVLAVVLAFCGWGISRLLRQPPGWFGYFAIASVAIWEGANLVPTLLNPFVLISLPGALARIASVVCLSAGIGLLPLVFRLGARAAGEEEPEEESLEEIVGRELRA